jgi:hypothetical protein
MLADRIEYSDAGVLRYIRLPDGIQYASALAGLLWLKVLFAGLL